MAAAAVIIARMAQRLHHRSPAGLRLTSEARLLHMGIGRDTYEAHTWFTRFGLNKVTMDSARRLDWRA